MGVSNLEFVFDLVLLPVEKTLQISQGVVCDTFVELTLHLTLASSIDTLVVDGELPCLSVACRLHADQVTFIVDFKEVPEEEEHLVLNELVGDLLLAMFTIHARDLRLVASLVDTREFHLLATIRVGAVKGEAGNRPVLQELLGLSLKNSVVHVRVVFVLVIFTSVRGMVLILLGVYTQALGYEVNINAVNMLDQSGNWWHNLLSDVPLSVKRQFTSRIY
jgi:hypothetical protein